MSWFSVQKWIAIASLLLITLCLDGLFISQPALARADVPAATKPTSEQSIQPYLDRVMQRVTEFRLANGLKFIVLERHQAPVVSFLTYANVGGADEPDGKQGSLTF